MPSRLPGPSLESTSPLRHLPARPGTATLSLCFVHMLSTGQAVQLPSPTSRAGAVPHPGRPARKHSGMGAPGQCQLTEKTPGACTPRRKHGAFVRLESQWRQEEELQNKRHVQRARTASPPGA